MVFISLSIQAIGYDFDYDEYHRYIFILLLPFTFKLL